MRRTDHSYRAFRKYYQEYAEKIYSYLYVRSGRNRALAEDLTSEVFLKALENFSSFQPVHSSFGAWIYTIARNHLIDHYRLRKVQVSIDDVPEGLLAVTPDLGAALDEKNTVQKVTQAIDLLPQTYREVLTLKFLQGFDNNEIGAALGKSQTNVRVLVHRSLIMLKKSLNP